MMKFRLGAVLSLSLLALVSCTSRKHCNALDAELIGAQDGRAFDGSQSGLKRGSVCDEEYTAVTFRKDYLNGYDKALKESCTTIGANNLAALDVAQNAIGRPSLGKLDTCQNVAGVKVDNLRNAYVRTYLKGMCTDERVSALAVTHGKALGAQDTTYIESVCGEAGNRAALGRAYQSAYTLALKSACEFGAIKTLAQTDARKKVAQANRLADLEKCPGDKWNINQLYSSTYDNEMLKIQIEEEQRRRQEAERLAAERSNVVSVCTIASGTEIEISMNNLNGNVVNIQNAYFEMRLLDSKGRLVAVDRTKSSITQLGAGEKNTFRHRFPSHDMNKASQCGVRLIDQ